MNVSVRAAKVYAQALLEIGAANKNTEVIISSLREVMDVFRANREAWVFFESPKVARKDKVQLLMNLFHDQVPTEVLNLLTVLVHKNRETILNNIVDEFMHLRDVAENRVFVNVSTAAPMEDAVRQDLLKALAVAAAPRQPVLRESVDAGLIGGMVLRMGDKVIDGSIRRRLDELRQATTLTLEASV